MSEHESTDIEDQNRPMTRIEGRSADNEPPTYAEMAEILPGQASRFCFTQWNMEPRPEVIYEKYATYMVYQLERCPSTGRKHYQGFFECNGTGPRFSTLHKLNPPIFKRIRRNGEKVLCSDLKPEHVHDERCYRSGGAWVKKCRGSQGQNYTYCTKDESRVEGTTPYVSGIPRSSISSFSPSQAWDEVLKLKFDRFASNAHMKYFADNRTKILATQCDIKTQLYKQLDFSQTRIYILFGPPGTGKTRAARQGIIEDGQLRGYMSPEESVQHCFEVGLSGYNSGTPWFDGYNGQKRIVIEELEKTPLYNGKCIDVLVALCSCNFYSPPVKGGTTPRAWTEVVITSNSTPSKLFSIDRRFDCLIRRLTPIRFEKVLPTVRKMAKRTWAELDSVDAIDLPKE